MEQEVVVEKYGWSLVKGYNSETNITFLAICPPEEIEGIEVYFPHNTFENGIMKVDNINIHIDSFNFTYLSSIKDFIIQQQQVVEFVQEAWAYCLENGFSNN